MTDRIRIIKHEGVKDSGSFEVRFADDRPPRYFYWDDVARRRLRPEMLTSEQALEAAKALERDRREKGKQSRRCTIRVGATVARREQCPDA